MKVQELKKPSKSKNKNKKPTPEDLKNDVNNSLVCSFLDNFESFGDFELLKDTYFKLRQFGDAAKDILERQKLMKIIQI